MRGTAGREEWTTSALALRRSARAAHVGDVGGPWWTYACPGRWARPGGHVGCVKMFSHRGGTLYLADFHSFQSPAKPGRGYDPPATAFTLPDPAKRWVVSEQVSYVRPQQVSFMDDILHRRQPVQASWTLYGPTNPPIADF
ncbi:hypothetical protein Bbelb_289730 [Branchiostoma belcheri]|nr:hypothetical protein Bbelb_289730 [Branchiostoma belcheri]